jgi:hypothetical protein
MRYATLICITFLSSLFFISCTKSSTPDIIKNGVDENQAASAINAYRTAGFESFPAVAAVVWNDTLSNAAYNFAMAKANDPGVGSDEYTLSNSHTIFDYPGYIGYHETAIFAQFYGYPANANVKTVIDAGVVQNESNNTLTGEFMSSNGKKFGMAEYAGSWYLIISN